MLKRLPLVTTLVVYAIKLFIVTVVLLHDFANKDSAIIAALLILIYGMISAQIASESGVAARWFLALTKFGEPPKQATTAWDTEPSALTGESLEHLTRKDMPHTWAGAAFNLILATAATVKLLYLLASFETLIWLLIFVAVLVGGWLLLEVLVLLFKPTGFFARLSTRDWIFLTPVVLALLYVLLSALGLTHSK